MDTGIRIPVTGYGGHERLVEMFAKEYQRLGHEVHLLITEGSFVTGCTVHSLGPEGFPPKKADSRKAILSAWKFLKQHKKDFDLIHNFGRLIYLLPVLNAPVKKIMTYGREIRTRNINYILKLPNRNLIFTGCSHDLINRSSAPGNWKAVYNAIEFKKYQVIESVPDDAPLIFLGRIEKIKGCHTAIQIAKATGNTLIIAGNISPLAEEKLYFENEIAPHLDGKIIKHVGAVNDSQKNLLLGSSKALLFPIEWNEPFGIVMIEAMACGTPVIAFKCGSVDEVVEEGITGFKTQTKSEMIKAVGNLSGFNRVSCRKFAENKYDIELIALQYLNLHSQ